LPSLQLPFWDHFLTISLSAVVQECSAALRRDAKLDAALEAKLYHSRGDAYATMGKGASALADYDQALKRCPQDKELCCKRATLLPYLNRAQEGSAELQRLVKAFPDYVLPHLALAAVAIREGRLTSAIEHANTAIKMDRHSAPAYHLRANARFLQGQYQDCITDMQTSIQLRPLSGPSNGEGPYLLLAMAHTQQREYEQSIACLHMARHLNPASYAAQFELWQCYQLLGRPAVANYVAQELTRLDPKNAKGYQAKAASLNALGCYKEAITAATKALDLDSKDATGHQVSAFALRQLGQYKAAIERYDAALRINADDADSLLGKAWILSTSPESSSRNGKEALVLAKRAQKAGNAPHSLVLPVLAAAYAECGEYQEAIRVASQCLRLPDIPGTRDDEQIRAQLKCYEQDRPYRIGPSHTEKK
jgi:tetratricopeptide (TPR) repeat protein